MTATELPETLDETIRALLEREGYTLIRKIGEGQTRNVFEAEYNRGPLQKRRVVKIPKSANEINPQSVTTRINLGKGDLDRREILALNKVHHSNIVEIYDAFPYQEGRTITVEELYDAVSLEDLVNLSGPIQDPHAIRRIFSQVADGLAYLHGEEKILHRDIKPSNILVGKKDRLTKLTDLQNAGKEGDMRDALLTTRGATAYTPPQLLNALMAGKESRASHVSEVYALGVSLYYALMGKVPVSMSLIPDQNGTVLDIHGSSMGISLVEDQQKITSIDPQEHQRKLRAAIKKAPARYHKILGRCLLDTERKYTNSWFSHTSFKHDLEQATEPRTRMVWRAIRNYLGGATLLAGGIAGGIVGCNHTGQENRKDLSIEDMLVGNGFINDGLVRLLENSNGSELERLRPYFAEIKKRCQAIDKANEKLLKNNWIFISPVEQACNIVHMNRRMVYALIRSVLMEDGNAIQKEYGNKRWDISLVPFEFAESRDSFLKKEEQKGRDNAESQKIALGAAYLKQCIGTNKRLVDVYAAYFTDSREELLHAQIKAQSTDYFANDKKCGYGQFLSPAKQRLIERALALYHVTNKEGELHHQLPELLDSNKRPIKGLEAK